MNRHAMKQAQHYAAIASGMGLSRDSERLWNFAMTYLKDAYHDHTV